MLCTCVISILYSCMERLKDSKNDTINDGKYHKNTANNDVLTVFSALKKNHMNSVHLNYEC